MARKIQVELNVKDKGSKTVKKFSDNTASMMKKLAGPLAIGAVVASLTKLVKSTLDYGDQLHKLNLRLGISVKEFDKLRKIGELSGIGFNTLAMATQRMTRRIAEAAQGSGVAKKTLEDMGFQLEELAAMRADKQFVVVAEAIGKIENSGDKAAAAMKIFDTEGVKVIQMSKNLSKEMAKTTSTWNQQKANEAADFNDKMTAFKQTMQDLATEVLPVLTKAVDVLTDAWKAYQKILDMIYGSTEDPFTQQMNAYKASLADLEKRQEALLERAKKFGITLGSGSALDNRIARLKEEIDLVKRSIKVTEESNIARGRNKDGSKKSGADGPDNKPDIPVAPALPEGISEETKRQLQDAINERLRLQSELGARAIQQEVELAEEKLRIYIEESNREIEVEKEKIAEFGRIAEEGNKKAAALQKDFERQKLASDKMIAASIQNNLVNPVIDVVVGTKTMEEAFKEMATQILRQLAQIILLKAVAGLTGGGTASAMPIIPAAANGAVFKGGFQSFGNGGIANKPTLGLIGEGGMNEAIVPLPDGRSIPVEMSGGQDGATENTFIITAIDAASFVELARRNPEAIIAPLTEQIEKGNRSLRQNLKKAVS